MSDYFEAGEEFLEHYGVKGMKWGKTRSSVNAKNATAANARLGKATAANKAADKKSGPKWGATRRKVETANAQAGANKANKAQQKGSLSKAMERRKAKVAAINATREAAKNAPKDVTVNSQLKRNKYKTKAKGGQKQPVADEAVTAIVSRQKMKKSGIDALSNQELKDLSTRMNLEQQVSSLSSKRPKSMKDKFVEDALKNPQKTYETASKGAEALQKIKK